MILFILFVLGALVASFIGVVSARLNTGHSIVSGRSRCDACDITLPPIMLVPVVSYVFTGGRAQCCGAPLSVYSPLTEIVLGGLFVLSYIKLGLTLELALLLVALCLLLGLVLYDLSHQILPPILLYPFVVVAFLMRYTLSSSTDELIVAGYFAVGVAAFLLALHVFSRGRAMGFADTPLALGLALLVGPELALTGLVYSFWIGAIVGITILLRRREGARMGIEVPFAPFLACGFLLAYFFIQWNPFYPLFALGL